MRNALVALVALAGLSFATPANALEVGTSLALGTGSSGGLGLGALFEGAFTNVGPRAFPPTLDLRFEPVHLQIHVLEFLGALADDSDLFLGANAYYQVHDAPIAGPWSGVIQPGLSLDLGTNNDFWLALAAEARLGIQTASSAGFGLYAVPSFGFITGGDTRLMTGGTLQMSVWFGGS